MAGKFEIYSDKAGKFRFRLKAGNGEIILASQAYASKASCTNGIESVRKNAEDPARFVTKESDSGKFTFTLTAANKQVIGNSQSYSTSAACSNGIKSVGKAAADAQVSDLTA